MCPVAEVSNKVLKPVAIVCGLPSALSFLSICVQGGETEGLARVQYYLWDKNLIAEYFNTRNGMVGSDYSTKFSPWLAAGCLSPRRVHHEVRRYERARTENKSTYWVIFELIWRDYFRFFAVKHGSKIFFEGGIIEKQLQWSTDSEVCPSNIISPASGTWLGTVPGTVPNCYDVKTKLNTTDKVATVIAHHCDVPEWCMTLYRWHIIDTITYSSGTFSSLLRPG